jgi:copper chaperone
VKGSVSDLDGIESVDVNLEDGLVTVVYDEVKVELTHIKHAIEEQGFDVLT